MKTTTNAGIDYGMGLSNIDSKTGIRYGVISSRSLNPDVIYEVMSDGADYGKPTCPKCGGIVLDSGDDAIPPSEERKDKAEGGDWTYKGNDYVCLTCKRTYWSDRVYSEEPLGWAYNSDGYKLTDCLDSDVFVLESPFYTYAQFCSPCVPGAGNLDSPIDTPLIVFGGGCRHFPAVSHGINPAEICAECESGLSPKIYCLGHDWFKDDKAPYRVFRVSDDTEVMPDGKE